MRICAVLPAKASSQRDLHIVAQVRAALAAGAAAAARAAHAEHIVEDSANVVAKSAPKPGAVAAALLERGMAVAVIGRALVGVLQDLVGLVDFLEAVLGIVVARIAIRMRLHRQLAEGAS